MSPKTNMAEVVNASFTHSTSISQSLVKAAKDDVAESVIAESLWKGYSQGNDITGKLITD